MKLIKTLLLGLLIGNCAILNAQEKETTTPEDRAVQRTEKLASKIELTEDQKNKILDLNLMVENKILAVKNDPYLSDEKKKEYIKGNKMDRKNALHSLLTEEQILKLEELKADKKEEKNDSDH